jgi:G3E family GTPase
VVSQIGAADVIVLNKIDLVDNLEIAQTELTRLNPDALLAYASHAEVNLDLLFGREIARVRSSTNHVGKFESRTHESTQPIPRGAFEALVENLPPEIQRVKGIVRLTEAPQVAMVFQLVGRKWELRALADRMNSPEGNRLVAIGPNGSIPIDWDRALSPGN